MRASGGLAVAAPALPILTAGTGSPTANIGYSAVTGDVPGSPFGSLTLQATLSAQIGGRTILAIEFELTDRTYIVLSGNTHAAFLSGLQIWINGTLYTCSASGTTATNSYATVSLSNLFVSGSTYTVSFVAP